MTRCAYAAVSSDTLALTLPALLVCDSMGAPVPTGETSLGIWYQDSGQKLVMSLQNAVPLIRAITAGPGFSKDIGAFLDELVAYGSLASGLKGAFTLIDSGAGVQGVWWFYGVEPQWVVELFADSTQQAALASLILDPDSSAGMLFEFSADTLTGLLSKRIYGDAALAQVIDTVTYNLSVINGSDSTWLVLCNVTGDTLTAEINQAGDVAWTFGDSTHTYFQRPEACPNWVSPPWLYSMVLAGNVRQP